jgi:ribosomal protein L37AE/L43A
MSPGYGRSKYNDAIERVRAQHQDKIAPGHSTVECPRCATKQVLTDAPGMRRCVKCGFEFRAASSMSASAPLP